MADAEPEAITGKWRARHQEDLCKGIEKGDYPSWTMFMQVMPERGAADCP